MSDSQPGEIRIGTAERESAISALNTHLRDGRLDADEYGERYARASSARTRGELTPLFTDLPQPHPKLPGMQAPRLEQPRRRGFPAVPAWLVIVAIVAVGAAIGAPWLFGGIFFWVFVLPWMFGGRGGVGGRGMCRRDRRHFGAESRSGYEYPSTPGVGTPN